MTKADFSPIPDNRLEGETPLRQTQLIMLRLLRIFDAICKENNLTYWIDAGTLLGAVRHKGFIPWDDDIDVIMPWEDYCKFVALPEEAFPKDVFFQSEKTDKDYICPWVKLRDRFSWIEEAGGPYPYSQAAFIDIFPGDFITENQHKHRNLYHFLPPYNHKLERIVKHLSLKSKLRIVVQNVFYGLFKLVTKIPAVKKSCLKSYSKGEKHFEYLSPIRWEQQFPEDYIFPLSTISFEGYEFACPAKPHEYLTLYFGDYMTPPPEEKRVSEHAVTAFYPTGPNPHFSALNWKDFYGDE